MDKKQGIVQGAFVLLVSSFLVKILGALFKIPLTNLLGASGIGTFSVAYNIYVLLFVVSTSGLPVSISKLISEENARGNHGNVSRIVKCACLIFGSFSAIISVCLMVFAKQICSALSAEGAYLSVMFIAPAVLIITIVSIFRGYYQGHHNMTPTAISQVLEAFTKLLVGYFFAKYLLGLGYSKEIASAGAIFGVTLSTVVSALYLAFNIVFIRKKSLIKPNKSGICLSKSIIKLSVPITITASVLSLNGIIDMVTILRVLKSIGFSSELANEYYGVYNMANTVYSLPQTLITAIAISIIPSISELFAKNNQVKIQKTINLGLFLTYIFSLPCAIGLASLSSEILGVLYYKQPQDVILASPVLVMFSLGVVFVSVTVITNSNMQGISKQFLPLKAIIFGVLVKIITNLIFIPKIGISGAAFGTVLCFFSIATINTWNLKRYVHLEQSYVKPAIGSIIIGIFLHKIKQIYDLTSVSNLLLAIFVSAILYFIILYILGIRAKKGILYEKGQL